MPRVGQTVAQKHKEARRESLRELLSSQGHLQHVTDLLNELANLEKDLTQQEVNRIDKVINHKLSLIKKFLPDVKAIELDANVTTETHEEWLARLKNLEEG